MLLDVEIGILTHRKKKFHTIKFKKHNKVQKTNNKGQKTHNRSSKNTQTGNTIKTKGIGLV